LYLAGLLTRTFGWRTAFAAAALGPLLSIAVLALLLPPPRFEPLRRTRRLFDFGPIFGNRRARGFILGYAAHCWELFALRAWMVAYFVFLAARGGPWRWSAASVAAVINLLGPFASILGNEAAAGRRRRVIVTIMGACGLLAIAAGAGALLPTAVAVAFVIAYFVAIMSDSAALTAGLVESTPLEMRGGAMALHSLAGFGAGLLAPAVFGFALDTAGGDGAAGGWILGFATLAAVSWAGGTAVFRAK
jgi:MFS family permease